MTKRRHSFKTLMDAVSHVAAAMRLVGYSGARKALETVIEMDRSERRCRRTQGSTKKD